MPEHGEAGIDCVAPAVVPLVAIAHVGPEFTGKLIAPRQSSLANGGGGTLKQRLKVVVTPDDQVYVLRKYVVFPVRPVKDPLSLSKQPIEVKTPHDDPLYSWCTRSVLPEAFVFVYSTVVAPAGVVNVCQTSSSSVPVHTGSLVPDALTVVIVAFIQSPFDGIIGSAIAPAQASLRGGGGGTDKQRLKVVGPLVK